MHSDRGRGPGYGDLLAALLALRPDTATARFDTVLAALVAEQRIDPEAARELRWWQRESLRAVGDFLEETAPGLLADLESSQLSAHATTAAAATAWEQANHAPTADPSSPPPAVVTDPPSGQDDEDPATGGEPTETNITDPAGALIGSGATDNPPSDTSAIEPTGPVPVAPQIVVDLRTPGETTRGAAAHPSPTTSEPPSTRVPDAAPPGVAGPPPLTSGRGRLLLRAPTLSDPSRGT